MKTRVYVFTDKKAMEEDIAFTLNSMEEFGDKLLNIEYKSREVETNFPKERIDFVIRCEILLQKNNNSLEVMKFNYFPSYWEEE